MTEEQPDKPKADCYSSGDRGIMVASQRLRARLLAPFLDVLVRLGVSHNALTLAALIVGLGFCPLFYFSKPLAFTALLFHVLLDGLDGPLARRLGVDARKGSFTDTVSDQTVIAASTAVMIQTGFVGVLPGVLYVFVYTVVVGFAMVRNALNIPYSWLVRPRFLVYVWFVVEVYLLPGTIDYLLWGLTALLAFKMLTGFYRIRKRLDA